MDQAESATVLEQKYSRRTFIKGVIATGATASSTGYLFRGSPLLGAATYQTATMDLDWLLSGSVEMNWLMRQLMLRSRQRLCRQSVVQFRQIFSRKTKLRTPVFSQHHLLSR